MEWDDLAPTSDPAVRHCGSCSKPVYLCQPEDELAAAIIGNRFAAIPVNLIKDNTMRSMLPPAGDQDLRRFWCVIASTRQKIRKR